MKAVFLGTPAFAVPSLRALAREHGVAAVFTQPDRPKGRGNQVTASPVKEAAVALGIPIHQPERIRRPESVELLRSIAPEIMVVVGYGQIIPQSIIDIPWRGILNVHASLLPKYRGAAPIQWAIANGERVTGVTIMRIDAGLDTGDMLLKEETEIGADETAPQLSERLAEMGAELLIRAIATDPQPEKQNEAEATYAPILKKEDGRIDWQRSSAEIYNRMRGFTPWPGAFTAFRNEPLSITQARPFNGGVPAGEIRRLGKTVIAGCGMGALELVELQPAGKKKMSAEAFVNGYKPLDGEILGANS